MQVSCGGGEHSEEMEEASAVLDGLLLTVRVELGARNARLDEVARLRIGQIIDLGCQATDLVDLTVDGQRIARGELIDMEGRLGVRLVQVSRI
ncbi:MAG: FliM/FliN family flagellar motor switch protein [Pyrinomonadaceae bacterium]